AEASRTGSPPSSRAATTSRRCPGSSTPRSTDSRPKKTRLGAWHRTCREVSRLERQVSVPGTRTCPEVSAACERELLERLAARRDAELAQEALDVRAHGVLRDEKPLRDLIGAVMLVEQKHHLELAGGESRRDAIGHARA